MITIYFPSFYDMDSCFDYVDKRFPEQVRESWDISSAIQTSVAIYFY